MGKKKRCPRIQSLGAGISFLDSIGMHDRTAIAVCKLHACVCSGRLALGIVAHQRVSGITWSKSRVLQQIKLRTEYAAWNMLCF